MRHRVELLTPGPDGAPQGETWRIAAERGSAAARKKLEGPELPEHVAYLWQWAVELSGRSGVSQFGAAPLSYTTIRDWALLTGRSPTPDEVAALIQLDAAMRGAAKTQDSERPPPDEAAWPEKKNG